MAILQDARGNEPMLQGCFNQFDVHCKIFYSGCPDEEDREIDFGLVKEVSQCFALDVLLPC